jgi:hypothetical protein
MGGQSVVVSLADLEMLVAKANGLPAKGIVQGWHGDQLLKPGLDGPGALVKLVVVLLKIRFPVSAQENVFPLLDLNLEIDLKLVGQPQLVTSLDQLFLFLVPFLFDEDEACEVEASESDDGTADDQSVEQEFQVCGHWWRRFYQ